MIAVIFEVEPHPERRREYLDMAAALYPLLTGIEGFISVERFQSLTNEGKILSLSFFRDEEAVAKWRNTENHRRSQAVGRAGVLKDYRIRIASVLRDYGMSERDRAPGDSREVHDHR